MQLDYSFHFLPELRANLNLGYDYTKNDGDKGNYPGSYSSYTDAILPPGQGRYTDSKSTRENYLLDFYLNYVKDIKAIRSKIDVMAGYSWQHFKRDDQSQTYSNPLENYESVFISESAAPKEYYLISLFGRLNYTFMDKYLITFTLRDDGTSRFSPSNRWGLFPSVALAWRMSDEAFFKKFDKLSNLKLRASYGVTGQQNIGSDYYPYIATYNLSTITSTSQYQIGDKFYQILKPEAYNENIKWESTATWNVALDWGFFNNRLSGSVDLFYKETSDLLNSIPIPAGSNFTNKMTANIGNLENKGVEININATPIVTKDFSWDIGVNATWSKSKITKLTAIFNPDYVGVPTGGISMGTGNNIQIHSVGYAPNTFYVYEQVYDEYGNPVQDAFIDQNKDGIIDDKDLVLKHKSRPDVFFGFNMLFRYKNWDFGFNAHGSIGNWVFNDYNSARCSADYTFSNGQTVRNIPEFVVKTSKFRNPITVTQAKSDLFLENASFLKVDNITLGYSFKKLFNSKLGGRVSFTAQNPFVITKYSGLDPEVSSGIDNNAWPRPRIFVLGLNLNY
jgi:TonB-linked SusC/RagA family outer membrane protein